MSMDKVVVSVIVPVYNAEKYIAKCVDSILAQTVKDFELVLINDGSSDNSLQLCEKYLNIDSRVKIINNMERGGASKARNIGIEHAVGEYVVFVDSDDFVEFDLLEKLLSYCQNNDLVICGLRYVNDNGDTIKESNNPQFQSCPVSNFINNYLLDMNLNYTICGPCNKLFKRDIITQNKLKFNEKMTVLEDTTFVFNYLSFSKSVGSVDGAFYNYVQHGGSLITRFSIEGDYAVVQYAESVKCLLKLCSTDNLVLHQYFRKRISQACYIYTDDIYKKSLLSSREKYRLLNKYLDNSELMSLIHRKDLDDYSLVQRIVNTIFVHSKSFLSRRILHFLLCLKYRNQ